MAETIKRAASENPSSPKREKIKKVENEHPPHLSRVLTMSYVPHKWDKSDILNFIRGNTNKDIYNGIQFIFMEIVEGVFKGTCHVRFSNTILCREAKKLLSNVKYLHDGKRIWVAYENRDNPLIWTLNNKPDVKAMKARGRVPKGEKYHEGPNHNQHLPHNQSWQHVQHEELGRNVFKNNMIVMNQSKHNSDTYGLSVRFLESIGVTPPLTSKIFVDNLSTDYDNETLIRKLFSHAGTVTSVAIITRTPDIIKVKVEFDHPVEAVQAITMFHNQEVYSRKLVVCMDTTHNAYKRFLPVGLKAFGPGLGLDGLPIKNVRNTIEMQRAVNMLMNEIKSTKNQTENVNEDFQGPDEYHGKHKYGSNEYHANDSSSICSDNQWQQPPLNTSQNQMNINTPAVDSNAPAADNIQNTLATLATTLTNPVANNPLLALGALLNPQTSQMLQLLTQQSGNNLLTSINTLQSQVNPQPQGNQQPQVIPQSQGNQQPKTSSVWNVSLPANVQNNPGSNNNMQVPSPVVQGTHNMYSGQNSASGPNRMGGQNMADGSFMGVGQNMGGNPNRMGGQNTADGSYMGSGQNMGGNQNRMGGPITADGSHMGGGPALHGGFQGDADHNRRRDDCTLLFNYLPPSVTAPALFAKLQEFGEVRSADLTGPGRGIASFFMPRDAAACINTLDRTKVDGQTIEVRYSYL